MADFTITPEQRSRGLSALKRVHNGNISCPTDVVDTWKEKPSTTERELISETYEYVPVVKIVGTERSSTNRLTPRHLARALRLLCDEKYDPQRSTPHLAKIDGEYYVSGDGNHRTLAHKITGIEKMYAAVSIYTPSNTNTDQT